MSPADDPPRDINTRLLDERIDRALDRRFPTGSDGGGGGDELDARLEAVEKNVSEFGKSLERIESKIDQLPKSADFFELKGRVSQLPTVWQLFGLIVALFGLAFLLVRFGLAHI